MAVRGVYTEDDKNVMLLLSKISHALKTLDVMLFYISTEVSTLELMKDLIFPNVTSLKCSVGYLPRLIKVLQSQLILKFPKLKQLYVASDSPDVTFPPTLQKLVLMSLEDTLKFCKNILQCSRLHTLKIYKYESGDREIIHSILDCLAKTLKSLTIFVDPLFQFPRLPYLKSLRLHSTADTLSTFGLSQDSLHLNSETFLSLKYIDFPLIFYLSTTGSGIPFLSVKTLTLSLSAKHLDANSKTNFPIKDNFENLKILFPNATTICLKQKIPDQIQCKSVLKELICSELAPQIKEIQIKGANRDILGEMLEQNRKPPQISMTYSGKRDRETEALIQRTFELWTGKIGIEGSEHKDEGAGGERTILFSEKNQSGHKMTNVKKVKIMFRRHGKGVDGNFSDLKLNLVSIGKNLPGLMEIEIVGIQSEWYLKEFDDLAIEYPNILFRITKLRLKI